VTCGFTGWTVAIFLLRRALPGDSGHEDARTLYVRLPHLTVKLQGCAGPAKRQRPKKSSVALELRFGDRAMALCLRIEGKGRGGGGITSYGHLGCLWSAGLRLGMRLGQSRRRLGLKGDRLEVGDNLRVPHDSVTAAVEGAGGPSWAGCWAKAGTRARQGRV
jgi:hypothetical protein